MYEKEVEKLQEIIDDSKRIVFFGGAGVSTESNIPDFRSFHICPNRGDIRKDHG